MGFYRFILLTYGYLILDLFKKLSKSFADKFRIKNQKNFLLSCRRSKIIPKCLYFSLGCNIQFSKNRGQVEKLKLEFQQRMLNLLIHDTIMMEKDNGSLFKYLVGKLRNRVPQSILNDFLKKEERRNEKVFVKTRERNREKISRILQQKANQFEAKFKGFFHMSKSWVQNLSDKKIPNTVLEVLSLGPKLSVPFFCKAVKEVPNMDFIATIEANIKYMAQEKQERIRNLIGNMLGNFNKKVDVCVNRVLNQDQRYFFSGLYDKLVFTRKFLKQNRDLLVISADKTEKTVLITKEEYNSKMNTLLEDKSVYKKIKTNLSYSLQNKNNLLVKNWLKNKFISAGVAENLFVHNSVPAKIYGLIKLHKPGLPLRPIVSCINTPLYKLSKFFGEFLKHVVGLSQYHVRNSFEFVNEIKNFRTPKNFIFASFDVTSMYTNIPISMAIECVEKSWDKIVPFTSLPKNEFIFGLKTCLESTVFTFNGDIFKQIEGLAMGAPVSAVIANLVMEKVENEILKNIPFRIAFYKRYCDDILICAHKDEIQSILDLFNAYHPKIQFTLELEVNGKINFLDLTITHKEGKVYTSWYSKPSSSGRYTNFFSAQPFIHKRNVIRNLAYRVIHLTHPQLRPERIRFAKKILIGNCYPIGLIEQVFGEVCNEFYNGPKIDGKERENLRVVSLPYVPALSEDLSRSLRPFNLQVVSRKFNTTNCLKSAVKDTTPLGKQSNLIYEIPCSDCERVYIGETSQHLEKRLNGHKFDKNEKTALKLHCSQANHQFNFDSCRILKKAENKDIRRNLESINILKSNSAVNSKAEFQKFKAYFTCLPLESVT